MYGNWLVSELQPASQALFPWAPWCARCGCVQERTLESWRVTSVASVAASVLTSTVLAMSGYLRFRGLTQANLLNNYSVHDHLVNVTRLAYALTMVLVRAPDRLCARTHLDLFPSWVLAGPRPYRT
jgi:hypothetical protein